MPTLPKPTGEQTEVLYLPPEGHTVVIGSAGCGKTTMSLYRALHLNTSQLIAGGGTAVITFNKSLSRWMAAMLGSEAAGPDVLTFHGWARRVLEEVGVALHGYLSDPAVLRRLTNLAYLRVSRQHPDSRAFKRTVRFFSDELLWIENMGIETLDEYQEARRIGRGETRLKAEDREDVWAVRTEYLSLRVQRGFTFDLRDIASVVLTAPGTANSSPFHHIVIDEGQDLSPQMLRAVAWATPDEGSITFFGDPTQQIYGRQMSWKSAGFKIRKQWLFERNHRNTKEIAMLAAAIGGGTSDASIGRTPRRSGPKPRLVEYESSEAEVAATVNAAHETVGPNRFVAVLSRTHALSETVGRQARQAGVPVRFLSR